MQQSWTNVRIAASQASEKHTNEGKKLEVNNKRKSHTAENTQRTHIQSKHAATTQTKDIGEMWICSERKVNACGCAHVLRYTHIHV